ncbi:hypothetical protein GOBAR_DD28285 [Gossypium barbadense]|nr:hypothetical protein GOBAR_DD28285 [Gossypium barbadense]
MTLQIFCYPQAKILPKGSNVVGLSYLKIIEGPHNGPHGREVITAFRNSEGCHLSRTPSAPMTPMHFTALTRIGLAADSRTIGGLGSSLFHSQVASCPMWHLQQVCRGLLEASKY